MKKNLLNIRSVIVFLSCVFLLTSVSAKAAERQENMEVQDVVSETTPVVETETFYTRGAIMAFCKGRVADAKGIYIKERGICWSLEPDPTIENSKVIASFPVNGYYRGRMNNLTPNTTYYVKAYAINSNNEIGYGQQIEVQTLPKGNLTYTVHRENEANAAIYDRLESAMSKAVEYYNNFTVIGNKHLNVTYNAGVPTADANYAGNMRFGPNESYQRTGTALHEISHTVGAGQHGMWWNLMSNGRWQGTQVNKVLQFMTDNPNNYLQGDNMHFWPYGINGAHEDTGAEMLYITNVLIVQAMFEDSLPGSNVPIASKVFDPQPVKYYLKTEDASKGRNTSFLIDQNGIITNRVLTAEQALNNDNAAWYVSYDPATNFYSLRNAASGNYMKYEGTFNSSSGHQGGDLIKSQPFVETESQRYYFQLVQSCNVFIPNAGDNDEYFTRNSFGIVMNNTNNFQALDAYSSTSTGTWSYEAGVTNRQWSFLSEEELRVLTGTSIEETIASPTQGVKIYASEGGITLERGESAKPNLNLNIYSVTGQFVKSVRLTDDKIFVPLSKGFYVVEDTKVIVNR